MCSKDWDKLRPKHQSFMDNSFATKSICKMDVQTPQNSTTGNFERQKIILCIHVNIAGFPNNESLCVGVI